MQVILLDEHGMDVKSEQVASLFVDATNTVCTDSSFETIN